MYAYNPCHQQHSTTQGVNISLYIGNNLDIRYSLNSLIKHLDSNINDIFNHELGILKANINEELIPH